MIYFAFITQTLQEYVESDGNKLVSGDIFCTAIYTYTIQKK